MSLVRPVVKLDASALGVYPRASAAFFTLRRVASETEAPSVKVRETAEVETPAFRATSLRVIANATYAVLPEGCFDLIITVAPNYHEACHALPEWPEKIYITKTIDTHDTSELYRTPGTE